MNAASSPAIRRSTRARSSADAGPPAALPAEAEAVTAVRWRSSVTVLGGPVRRRTCREPYARPPAVSTAIIGGGLPHRPAAAGDTASVVTSARPAGRTTPGPPGDRGPGAT